MRALQAVILAVVCLSPATAQETPFQINSRGIEFFKNGAYSESEAVFREALTAYKNAPVLDVNGYAAALNNLAGALQIKGRHKEARELLEQVVDLDKRIKGEPEIVTSALNNLALIDQSAGAYSPAILRLQRILDRPGLTANTRAGVLHNLASLYFDIAQHKKAKEMFEASLRINSENENGRDKPATLAYLGKLAFLDRDNVRALDYLQRALEMRRSMFGENHPLVGLSMNDLGEFYRDTKQYERAAEVFEQSLQLLGKEVGMDHSYMGIVKFHFAESRLREGRPQEAAALYESSIGILERTLGPTHPKLAPVYQGAALAAGKLKQKSRAKEYAQRAEVLIQALVPYQRHTIDVSAFTRGAQ